MLFHRFQDLNTIHHELGHIQYQQQYKTLPQVTCFIRLTIKPRNWRMWMIWCANLQVYRDGANDGFHEAIGELMAMAGATPSHLFRFFVLTFNTGFLLSPKSWDLARAKMWIECFLVLFGNDTQASLQHWPHGRPCTRWRARSQLPYEPGN